MVLLPNINEARCSPKHLDLAVPGKPSTLLSIAEGYLPYAKAQRFTNANFFAKHPDTGKVTGEGLMAERGTVWPSSLIFGRPCLYVENGRASISVKEDVDRAKQTSMAVGGGPVLLRGGQPTALSGLLRLGSFLGLMPDSRRPRNIIGILPNGDIWQACLDEATLPECQEIGMSKGVVDLMNLDGGDSVGVGTVDAGKVKLAFGKSLRLLPSALVMTEVIGREKTLDLVDLPHGPPYKRLSTNFHEQEFACKHCGLVHVEPKLVDLLERIRVRLGNNPVTIISGCRCPVHNASPEVKGASDSRHLIGTGRPCDAADIRVKGKSPTQIMLAAELEGADGIHAYQWGTHVDTRGYRARW